MHLEAALIPSPGKEKKVSVVMKFQLQRKVNPAPFVEF